MNVPGSNLLATALRVIYPEAFDYFQYQGLQTNAIGLDVVAFAPAVALQGSIQAVSRSVYQDMGLDFERRYVMIWTVSDIDGLERGRAGDQIQYNQRRYQVVDQDDWHAIDGWNSNLFVQVQAP